MGSRASSQNCSRPRNSGGGITAVFAQCQTEGRFGQSRDILAFPFCTHNCWISMSDKEVILRSLQKVERRIRTHQHFGELARGVALFLLFPLGLKIADFALSFRGTVVFPVLGTWLLALMCYSIWLLCRKGTLSDAAASVDKKLKLQDELTTAYWFINNPRRSEWTDLQISRAAAKARTIDSARLYPRFIPRSLFIAAAMLFLFIVLNLSPFSPHRNWLVLQAAPTYS